MVSAPRCRPGARGLLMLLLLLPGARGLCGALPTFSRAVPHDNSRTEGFPIGTDVTYRCRDGFVKVPGQSDTLICLSNSEWSTIGEFCGPSCGTPPRLKSAVLSKEDEKKNYHANGTTVSYICRPGYERTELRPVITCLENFTWSEAPEFCRVIITQDKPTTVPPKGTEVAGTSSGFVIICICVIITVYIRKYQPKNRSYGVNLDSQKHHLTTEHDLEMSETKSNLILKVTTSADKLTLVL